MCKPIGSTAETVALLSLLALVACTACREDGPPSAPAPLTVKAAAVLTRDVPVYVEAIGETRGNTEIEIRARVEGFLESVDFEEGKFVDKGQLLYTIDPKPFEAALAEAQARLAQAEADLARAHQDVVRYEPLVAKNAISRQEYETAVAIERAQRSAVEAARATATSAQLDLGYTRVVAPDAGLAGKTEVYPGTLVGRGQSTLLTRISKIDPIHTRFTIAERDYLHYARRSEERRAEGDDLPLEMVLADGSLHPHPGRFVFIDRNVDPQTGTILLEAAFPNPGAIVRPGQFARVRAAVDLKRDAVLVPQRAVQELQGIYNVAVIGDDGKVEMRMVEPGERLDSMWVIDSGLEAGERIVVEGLQKVRPGVVVQAEMVSLDAPEPNPATGS
ncbi:MAG TPA: efflux RND transporter periplasmic adaptor subunit [Candidatus Polarisedimenticolaceae bacterium]|nr:efflux RND transporter periplasmic adaptor subunit [Candidatus Polarisedimenticolaceae bacterium]